MRATGAEIRRPHERRIGHCRRLGKQSCAGCNRIRQSFIADPQRRHPPCDHIQQQGRCGFTVGGNEWGAIWFGLANHARAALWIGLVVEKQGDLLLDDRALFLDDENFLMPFNKFAQAVGLDRPDHSELIDTDAEFGRARFVDAEIGQRLQNIEIGLTGGYDAKAPPARIKNHLIDRVGPGKGLCSGQTQPHHLLFLRNRHLLVLEDIEAVPLFRLGEDDVEGFVINRYRSGRLKRVARAFETDIQAAESRHRDAKQSEANEFLCIRGVQHGDHGAN